MSRILDPAVVSGTRLNEEACVELGVWLAAARASHGIDERAVADRLLLSTRQVRALETFDVTAFHNPRFFATALRKYAGFLDAPPQQVFRVIDAVTSEPDALGQPEGDPLGTGSSALRPPTGRMARWRLLLGAALVCTGVSFGYRWYVAASPPASLAAGSVPQSAAPAAPTAPSRAPADVMLPAPPAKASGSPAADAALAPDALPQPGRSGAYGSVHVAKGTWMFLRYATGEVVERHLSANETVVFVAAPTYLALGSTEVDLTLADRLVDVTPFIVNGQLRMRAADLALER